jgi:hypothetical protein
MTDFLPTLPKGWEDRLWTGSEREQYGLTHEQMEFVRRYSHLNHHLKKSADHNKVLGKELKFLEDFLIFNNEWKECLNCGRVRDPKDMLLGASKEPTFCSADCKRSHDESEETLYHINALTDVEF